MQFVTNGFQTAVVKLYDIKSNEVKFLDWFYQFFSTGKMTAIKNRENNKYYFYIDYSYVMDSIKSINWNEDFKVASQMLRRILSALESKKVIEKVTLQTQNGRKVYIRFVEKALTELRSKNYADSIKGGKTFKEKRIESRKGRGDVFEECNIETEKLHSKETEMLYAEETKKSHTYNISSQTKISQTSNLPSVTDDNKQNLVKKVAETISEKLLVILKSNNLESKFDSYINFCAEKFIKQMSKHNIINESSYLKTIMLSDSTVLEFSTPKLTKFNQRYISWKPLRCSSSVDYEINNFCAGIK